MSDPAHKMGKIKDRPPELQPREKLMTQGVQSLSETELLAILLRTGTAKRDVLELAQTVLETAGGLEGLFATLTALVKPKLVP